MANDNLQDVAPPAEDDAGQMDFNLDRRAERRHRGLAAVSDVTFSVCLDIELPEGQTVFLTGTLPELQQPIPMRPCDTGSRRLWRTMTQITPPAPTAGLGAAAGIASGSAAGSASGSAAAGLSAMNLFPGILEGGHMAGVSGFRVNYFVRDDAGQVVHPETTVGVPFDPVQYYYHRTRFLPKSPDPSVECEAFPLFVHDEIHLLQSGATTARDFLQRYLQLVRSMPNRRMALLNKALEDLIQNHWGEETRPPHQTVLAVAAMLGCLRSHKLGYNQAFPPLYEDYKADVPSLARNEQQEQEAAPSLVVCRWIVRHCPAAEADNDPLDEIRNERERGREALRFQRLSMQGVMQASSTLYNGEKTFEWLRVLNFLPEHEPPLPLDASQFTGEEQQKLESSFARTVQETFANFQEEETTLLRGLCTFCPSIAGLHSIVTRVRRDFPAVEEALMPMVFNRIRSLNFGPQDKEALKVMVQEVAFMRSDDMSISLLTNMHHPSSSFQMAEIISFVKLASEEEEGVRPAGPQLQCAVKRWLTRYYGRPPERERGGRSIDRTQQGEQADPAAGGGLFGPKYNQRKGEIREVCRRAIRAWHMVLKVPCFRHEEETLRTILFELSQAYFIKDPEPIMILDVMLELEQDIQAVASVRNLEIELQRIAIKAMRDAQDTSESLHNESLLHLLFDTPTPLRFTIIEALVSTKEADAGLGRLLQSGPIWSRLLSKTWLEVRGLSKHGLGQRQQQAQQFLQQYAAQLQQGTIQLQQLRKILKYRETFEELVEQVTQRRPDNIAASDAKLANFDTDFDHLRKYVKLFCAVDGIESSQLQSLIDDIHAHEQELELNVAATKFEHLPVRREHLKWLWSLRASDVFAGIWKSTVEKFVAEEKGVLRQEQVVAKVIPSAKEKWEALAESMETGTAILGDIRWCVTLDWAAVKNELRILQGTAPKTQGQEWVPHAETLTKDMRLAAKLQQWAPSILHIKHVLSEIFSACSLDCCVKELQLVVKEYETMWDRNLGCMVETVEPYRKTINILSEPMQDYTIAMAKHSESLTWLLKHSCTEDFNRLITLCRPNTDDSVILAAIASLQQTRTFLASVLYEKTPYDSLQAFLLELSRLKMDESVHESLLAVQKSFDPMLDLLTTHSRTPGVQAVYDLKKIHDGGEFTVVCSMKESEQLQCRTPDNLFSYEGLAELRRQLLMADIPAEMDGAANLPAMLEELVEKLQLLEEYGQCTMELFTLGHFAYSSGQQVLCVKPGDTVDEVRQHLEDLQQKLADWQMAVDRARSEHYYLNYFTVRELCFLVKSVPHIAEPPVWDKVWPLLRVIETKGCEKRIHQELRQGCSTIGSSLSGAGASEVEMLDALGALLGRVFAEPMPTLRPLTGLKDAKHQLQGDLLIQNMQLREKGVPIFVCCADEQSKVTELVLSIYAHRERIPEAEELLLCSSHTTVEEIELLLRRFFRARAYGREERLYCLGNVHLLPYVVQCGTVEALTRLEECFGFEDASALVFVSGLQNQMLTNALQRHNLGVSVLPKGNLVEAVAKIGEKYHGRQMEAVTGEINGVGKTHYIYRQVMHLQQAHGDKPIMHHVEIRENTDISALVSALLSDPTDPELPTAVYIDLAHILPSHVDTLLFELLVVGVLRDTQHQKVYHRRPQDLFFVELPNTPFEVTAKGLSFCLLLQRTFLKMGPDRLEMEMPIVASKPTGSGAAPYVQFVKNDNLELVGKVLAAMEVDAFHPKSNDFDIEWKAASAPVVDPMKNYEMLVGLCSSETSPPSFLVLMNFVKYLGAVATTAESWNMMNVALLQCFDQGLKHFKHVFVRLLIETSRDFALRQVPKQMTFVEASPLAMLVPQALARSRSQWDSQGVAGPLSLQRETSREGNRPTLERQRSHQHAAGTQNQAVEPEAQVEASGVGRIGADSYVERFDQMPSWETCVHPIASFKKAEGGTIFGCNIMSLHKDFLPRFIDRDLENSLNLNDMKLEKDWTKVSQEEAIHFLHSVEGGELLKKSKNIAAPTDYVMTIDNLLKLLSIQQRLKYGLPVILMGETGCGKTALVNFLARALDFRLRTLNIHGGITDEAIMKFLDEAIEGREGNQGVLVFFDEINAANCMALFKTIIIDRVYGNKQIPEKVRIISCCNPYRLRKTVELEDVALVFQHTTGEASGITDPMKKLVYRVHPLPESLIDVVSDFGSLSEKSEELYISAILRKELPKHEAEDGSGSPTPPAQGGAGGPTGAARLLPGLATSDSADSEYDNFVNAFTELLCQSQIFVREANSGERSVVSMRDIVRAARVFKWFLTYYSKLRGVASIGTTSDRDAAMRIVITPEMRTHLRSAVILTLGYCYHSRLDRNQRWGYRHRICDTWKKMRNDNAAMEWLRLDSAVELEEMLVKTQHDFVSQMDLGEGIALNEALRENLFMLLVSIMNQIPILLIGKPGCSKSLAMNVLQSNLNGDVSNREFFKSMPAVDVVAYQCSPLSTPEAIINAFTSARQSNIGNKRTIVCVLLDEVGLAEESPHLPLKVLHRELDDLRGIACVSISNWALDAAKMSRCVTLYRPAPTVTDLCTTAEGMVASTGNVKSYLRSLSEAFFEIYGMQRKLDFWGMREFYSSVRVINSELKAQVADGKAASLEPQLLMKTVQRNFGGRPAQEMETCIQVFFERMGMSYEAAPRYSMTDLIRQNLEEPDARHLMLLTKNNAALRLLFESGLRDHNKAEVMFGSTFPNEQSDVFVAMNLQRIKSFMQQPISLVMVHCDSLYESLYDLLNQHYMEYAGRRYVRIAHGSKAKQCPIHKRFRVIVITEINDAYFRLAPPLLNRFEKQIFLRKDLMERGDEALLNKLTKFWEAVNDCMAAESKDGAAARVALNTVPAAGADHRIIAGYHGELLSSLVFMLRRRAESSQNINQLFDEAKRLLTLVLTPEAVCIIAASLESNEMQSKFGFDLVEEYFERQRHSDVLSFTEGLVTDRRVWCDDAGAQIMVLTYSPIRGKVGHELQRAIGCTSSEISLHELSSSQDVEKCVKHFYDGAPERGAAEAAAAPPRRVLLIHADPVAASPRMIEHCRFVCEKMRSEFLKSGSFAQGSMFVILVVHLQRGNDSSFSFDYDSQWHFVFLDSVEPAVDMNSMPPLEKMLDMPLIDVVSNLDFRLMLRNIFRTSLSRLIYPHSRKPEDLQRQIHSILKYLQDDEFVSTVRDWTLSIMQKTPKGDRPGAAGTVGQDRNWFASIAGAAHELALAGTFRAALHTFIAVLVGSLLTVFLAHSDRNGGLPLLADPRKRDLWLTLSRASLTSELSGRLHHEARMATAEPATAQHEVGTDATTQARPFASRFPTSWFVSRNIDGWRHIIEALPAQDRKGALATQYQISSLHDIGLVPELGPELLDDYLADFAAMHLEWTQRVDRCTQTRLLKKMMRRTNGGDLVSILEVHQLFWQLERQVAFCINLLNAVPAAVPDAEELIDTAELSDLNLDLLILVHKTLTLDLQEDRQQLGGLAPHIFYRDWLSRKMVVAGLTKDLLADHKAQSHEKLLGLMRDTEPRIETMALMLEDVAVPLNLPLEVVGTFASELPEGKIRQSSSLQAILEMANRIGDMEGALAACSAFLESWILDVCLRDAEAISDLEDECLRLMCSMAAGLPLVIHRTLGVAAGSMSEWSEHQECGIATLGKKERTIPRSDCLNLALLRKLVVTSEGEAKRKATARIEDLLKSIAKHELHNDTTFATRYTVLCEEEAARQLVKLSHPSEWPSMTLEAVFKRSAGDDAPARMLEDIGKIRWLLTQYASILCTESIDKHLHSEAVARVGPLLQTDDAQLAPVCRSVRLYLLKCIERARGLSFLRTVLAELPLTETTWVMKWRNLHDIDFEKFIGAALVPKWSPFSGDDVAAEYHEAKMAVYHVMVSTATDKLDKFARDCQGHDEQQKRRYIAGLLLALCQETGIMAALEDGEKPPWRLALNSWLANSKELPVNDKERMLLRIFAGDDAPIMASEGAHRDFLRPFIVFGGKGMYDLLRWRFLGHLAAVLMAAPPSSLLAALRQVMLEPESLMYGEHTYLPSMDEDIRNWVMKALLERGENIWKFKSHWYKCTCGYTFFIGECGRPMETTECPGCALPIGGRDHNKTEHTSEDDDKDRSPQGYMLPPAEKDEKHLSFREVQGSLARAIRILLHGAMYCGLAAQAGDPMPRIFDHLVNRDSLCTMHQEPESKYIGDHFVNDWAVMTESLSTNEEDLAVGLHILLKKMGCEVRDDPKGPPAANGTDLTWEKLNLELRNKWEETINTKYLKKLFREFDSQVTEKHRRWGEASEDGKFVAELREAADVRDFPKELRGAKMPQLWAYRMPVTLDTLQARMGSLSGEQGSFPFLCTVLQRPLFHVLPALGLLCGIFEWHSLVINRFSGRISRSQAGQVKVGEFLDSIQNPAERETWQRAYAQFEKAWHIAWPHIERHECLEIPQHFRRVRIDRESPLLFFIADQQDEGICPLALTQWLTERHNELVTSEERANDNPDREDARAGRVGKSSRLLGQHDIVKYDELSLMHFVRSRCVTYGVGGRLNFDFKQLEQQLRREFDRPSITIELRGFQWLGENLAQASELKAVIKQKDLQPDVVARLRAELNSPPLAWRCLTMVQMASSFIQKSGTFSGEHAGETMFCEYITSVLAESADSIPSATARSEVHLWHLCAFEKVLKQIIKQDPMDKVDPKYRAELEPELLEELLAAKVFLPASLLGHLANFAEAQLDRTFLGEDVAITDTLKAAIDISEDAEALAAVEEHLPRGLKMKHWVATHKVLSSEG